MKYTTDTKETTPEPKFFNVSILNEEIIGSYQHDVLILTPHQSFSVVKTISM